MRFAPYSTIFGNKRPQKGCKCRPLEINIHFVAFTYCPILASKQTFARIDFLRQGERLVNRKGTHNVKFVTEKLTKVDGLTSRQVNELIVRLIVFWHKYVDFNIRT